MLERIKNNLENRAGLSEGKLSLLAEEFKPLGMVDQDLPAKVLTYVLDGKGEEVLKNLENLEGCGKALKLRTFAINYTEEEGKEVFGETGVREKFFNSVECRDGAFYLRLARVYNSALKRDRYVHRGQVYVAKPLEWLDNFLMFIGHETDLPVHIVEEMLSLAGENPDIIVRSVFFPSEYYHIRNISSLLKGFRESVLRHKAVIFEALEEKDLNRKIETLRIINRLNTDPEPFLEKITGFALSSAKTLRREAEKFLRTRKERTIPILKAKVLSGTAEERYYAVKLLGTLAGKEEKEFFLEIKSKEKSKKISDLISEILSSLKDAVSKIESPVSLPPLPAINDLSPLKENIREELHKLFKEYNKKGEALCKKSGTKEKFEPVRYEAVNNVFSLLQNLKTKRDDFEPPVNIKYYDDSVMELFKKFLETPGMELIHVIRFLLLLNYFTVGYYNFRLYIIFPFDILLRHYRKAHKKNFGLREVAQVFRTVGLQDKYIGRFALGDRQGEIFNWEKEAVWPYFMENTDILEEVFDLKKSKYLEIFSFEKPIFRKNAYRILLSCPHIPGVLINRLLEIAIGTPKEERPSARKCLEKEPGIREKIISALFSGSKETRALAAEWLGDMGAEEAVPHIEKALKKEKEVSVITSFINSLEKLGLSPEKFLDREKILKEAKKEAEKSIPEALSWFPFENLPSVHLSDTGKEVEKEIIIYFLLKSYKLKSPSPDPVMKLYFSYFVESERENLGKFVLFNWINRDTEPVHTPDEAKEMAEKDTAPLVKMFSSSWHDTYYKEFLDKYLKKTVSAIKEKGILAIPSACGGRETVLEAGRYIERWSGQKVSQCKTLIEMLSCIDHPSAIQLLNFLSGKSGPKTIKEEALKYINLIAERKGWTLEELSDRTVPTAGFSEKREMELDYGKRKFIARLEKDFSITLRDFEGKIIKSLPSPGKEDDPEKVKEGKKNLNLAKKELKALLKIEKERFYEAICTGKTWKYVDWNTYLNRHPVTGYYCQSLIWGVIEDDRIVKTFRPLDDGSFSDYEDEEVTLKGDEKIVLLHSCNIPEEVEKAWIDHMSEYDIVPLFQQFNKEFKSLSEEEKNKSEISDFEGYLVEAFTLRGEAKKAGYTRGTSEDGPWFSTYKKSFSGLKIEAVIEFTGNCLPEENRTVALRKMYFVTMSDEKEYFDRPKISLREIPPVLLCECRNDLKMIALKGTGYDKDWEKKALW